MGEPCDIMDSSDEMDAQEESTHERSVSRKKKSKRHKGMGLAFPRILSSVLVSHAVFFQCLCSNVFFFNTIKCIVPVIVNDSLLFQDSKIDSNIYNTLLFLNSARDTHTHSRIYIYTYFVISVYICVYMCTFFRDFPTYALKGFF